MKLVQRVSAFIGKSPLLALDVSQPSSEKCQVNFPSDFPVSNNTSTSHFIFSSKAMSEKHGLILLNLGGLLFYRPKSTRHTPRPHLASFLDTCFEHFHVMVWSTAMPHNVDRMLGAVFSPKQQQDLYDTWTRKNWGLSPTQYRAKFPVTKRLDKVLAETGDEFSRKDVMIIGDSGERIDVKDKENWIKVKTYYGDLSNNALEVLTDWLLELIEKKEEVEKDVWDVCEEIKANPPTF